MRQLTLTALVVALFATVATAQFTANPYGVAPSASQSIGVQYIDGGTFGPGEPPYLRLTGGTPSTLGFVIASTAPGMVSLFPGCTLLVDIDAPMAAQGAFGFTTNGTEECLLAHDPSLAGTAYYIQFFNYDAMGALHCSNGLELVF